MSPDQSIGQTDTTADGPTAAPRDHGGGVDAAARKYGGTRSDWCDLSTGINPLPYPIGEIGGDAWTALPDQVAQQGLIDAARRFWQVPDGAAILAAPGASALIARIPALLPPGRVDIPTPTYNEHAAAFRANGWVVDPNHTVAQVVVHPNNPNGRWAQPDQLTAPLCVIDESFCDVAPNHSLMARATRPGTLILKSFGKFWGLAGLRLGFVIGDPALIAGLADMMGPWAVSGPALTIGTRALNDPDWAVQTRTRLNEDAAHLDAVMQTRGARVVGGTSLFRLYEVPDAAEWQDKMAQAHVWSRIFPYSAQWLRLGLPAPDRWKQLETAV